jgi:hypothetical protein
VAYNCSAVRTNLARQTPVFDENFLDDFISEMVLEPFMGRHMTATWEDGKDELFYDKVHVEQPNFTTPWQRISSAECGNACEPPRTLVGFGTTRDSVYMSQLDLQSQPYCLQQLRGIPHVGQQIGKIYSVLREMPMAFIGDFLRTRYTSFGDTLQIAGSSFNTFAITSANTAEALTTINLGSTANLPTSELTLPIMEYYGQLLGMNGYDKDSGLPAGMRNIVTHSRTWQKLTAQNPELRSQIRPETLDQLSPLYKIGKGISANPWGFLAPTFDEKQVRFQTNGSGLLQRVFPYLNTTATTGKKPIVNPAWFNARYALSYILHPKAATLYTPKPKRIHEMIPSVNTSMFGKWDFINNQGIIRFQNPDGTTCDKNNDHQFWFYWLAHLEAGFKYEQRNLVMPILHLIDGSGAACVVNSPVCGTAPQYVTQDYSGNPVLCET